MAEQKTKAVVQGAFEHCEDMRHVPVVGLATVDDKITLGTLNYRNYGIFLITKLRRNRRKACATSSTLPPPPPFPSRPGQTI